MKKAGFLLAISLLFPAYSLVLARVEPPRGLIKGKVTDRETPRPNSIAGATVTVPQAFGGVGSPGDATTTTDSAGNYEIPDLPSGEYVIIVTKPGYYEWEDYVTVTPGGETLYDVRLSKTYTLVDYFWKTGPFRWLLMFCFVLLLLSVPVAAVYIINRVRKLGESKSKVGEAFMSRVREALQNDHMPGAISVCDEVGELANILKAGLLRYAESSGRGEAAGEGVQRVIWEENVREAMEKAGVTAKRELKFHRSLFAMFGVISGMALLCGFLGTVTGTFRLSEGIAIHFGTSSRATRDIQLLTRILSGGISEASLSSIIGLTIAIASAGICLIAFIIYKIYEKKANALIWRVRQTFAEMVSSLFTV